MLQRVLHDQEEQPQERAPDGGGGGLFRPLGQAGRDPLSLRFLPHGEVQAIADRETNFACQQISWNIDTIGDAPYRPDKPGWGAGWSNEGVGTPVVVFNSHPWEVDAFVTVHDLPKRMTDEDGNLLPAQSVRSPRTNGRNDKWEIGFRVTLPALGYRTLRAFYQGETPEQENPFRAAETTVVIRSVLEI